MSAPKFYAALRPSGRIAGIETTAQAARDTAARIYAEHRNRIEYAARHARDWRKAKAAGWSVQGVTVRF